MKKLLILVFALVGVAVAQTTVIYGNRDIRGFFDAASGTFRLPQSTVAALPAAIGVPGRIYVVTDGPSCTSGGGSTAALCRSNGTAWVTLGGSGGGGVWGSITGTLGDQLDLAAALGGKEPTIAAGTTAQYWRGDKSWQTLSTAVLAAMSGLYEVPLTFSSGLTRSTNTITCNTASASVFGCLPAADWTTFNGKQPAIAGAPGTWPSFAAVATSGSYADLSSKPAIYGTVQENGVAQTQRSTLNLTNGVNITVACSDVASITTCSFALSGSVTAAALTAQYIDWSAGSGPTSIANKPTIPSASSATPLMDGVATAGSAAPFSREDHRHPTDTSLAPKASPIFTGQPTIPDFTLANHTHQNAAGGGTLDAAAFAAGILAIARGGTGAATTSQNFVFAGPTSGSGAPSFRTLASGDIPNNAATTSGNAGTATALAANGTNCSAGSFPLGVDASGNAESCTAALAPYSGTATATVGTLADGACSADGTITVTGAATGDHVYASWPSTLAAGLLGTVYVSATDTVKYRLCNLSGTTVTVASATYGARIVK